MEQNSSLRVAFYILLPSFLQSSGVIPADALAQVVNNAKSDLQTVFGVSISEIKLTYVPTTAAPPTNMTTSIAINMTTTQTPTIATTEKSDDWKWIVIGVVVGVVVIVIIIIIVVLV